PGRELDADQPAVQLPADRVTARAWRLPGRRGDRSADQNRYGSRQPLWPSLRVDDDQVRQEDAVEAAPAQPVAGPARRGLDGVRGPLRGGSEVETREGALERRPRLLVHAGR